MELCANCPSPAVKAYRVGVSSRLFYCTAHFPAFLRAEKYAPLIEETEFFQTKRKEALEKLTAPKPAPKPARKRAATTTPRKRKPRASAKKPVAVETTEVKEIDKLEVHVESTEEVTQ
jgi:hypothetical protein